MADGMILVAGGAGYIGSHVNKYLHQKGYATVVLDNLVRGHQEFVKWGEFVFADLANREQIRQCFSRYPIQAVMHFSAFAYVGESVDNPALYYQNNVVNTLNLIEVMREYDVKYFIFSSSCAVYGMAKKIPITEDHPFDPITPYGRTKLMIEQILTDYDIAYGMKYVNLRYFNAAGADPDAEIGEYHEPETHLIPLAVFAALGQRNQLEVFGTDYPTPDGTCVRDYVHVNDLADAHVKALEYLKASNKSNAFNLGNDKGFSVYEVINAVKKISKRDFSLLKQEKRHGDPPVLISSSNKARRVLQWTPKFNNIDDIIATAWNWHKREGVPT